MKCKNYIENYPKGFPRCKATGKICMNQKNPEYCTNYRQSRIKKLEEKQQDYCAFIQEGGKLSTKGEESFRKVNYELGVLYHIEELVNGKNSLTVME